MAARAAVASSVEHTTAGRIVIPPDVPRGVALFYTTIDIDGRLDGDKPGQLMDVIRERFGIEATLNTCTQVHGATIARGTKARQWRECDSCDALIADQKNVALGIKVADCLPVTMVDSAHSVIANIHSGWRGAVQQITAATLDALQRETAFEAAEARAFLGPSIRVCCFEVGEEVATRFPRQFVERSKAKPHVDLVAFTKDILEARGIRQVVDSGLCTRCDGSIFHSFRRDGKTGGRNLAVIAQ
ncbi:MAG TPA: polyphenol oxidase family protein [Thermoanaerobaculia bacterium]|nr:polyphenol oxidase family protein [Thermoanaerobaculia bacterium]